MGFLPWDILVSVFLFQTFRGFLRPFSITPQVIRRIPIYTLGFTPISESSLFLTSLVKSEELKYWQEKGYQLRYLPEQQAINDQKYRTTFTAENATLFPIE